MNLHPWLGLAAVMAIAAIVLFAFRQGFKVKPDSSNRDAGGLPPGSGAG
jgi:hypothetical protein